jgi:hypothetical protein
VEECLSVVDRALGDLRRVRSMLLSIGPTGRSGLPAPSSSHDPCLPGPETEPPGQAVMPTGSCVAHQSLVPAVVPTGATSPLPNGLPAVAPPRKVGRLRWG